MSATRKSCIESYRNLVTCFTHRVDLKALFELIEDVVRVGQMVGGVIFATFVVPTEDLALVGLRAAEVLLDRGVEVVSGAVKIRIVERGLAHAWSLRRR